MAVGHGTWTGIGAGVITLGAAPGGFGAYEVVGSHQGPWNNAWFDLAAALWIVGAVILVITASHFVYEWRRPTRPPASNDVGGYGRGFPDGSGYGYGGVGYSLPLPTPGERISATAWAPGVIEYERIPKPQSNRSVRRTIKRAEKKELNRQQRIIQKLHTEYIQKFPNTSPEIRAGTEPLPFDWVERRLTEMGEPWRYTHYLPE